MLNPKGKMWLTFSKYVSKKGNLYSPKLLHSKCPSFILHLGYKEGKAALSECINQKSTGIHLSSADCPVLISVASFTYANFSLNLETTAASHGIM